MQGKTTESQSLDAQLTFVDILDKSTRVQFNINAKQHKLDSYPTGGKDLF